MTHLLANTSWDPIRLALQRKEEIQCVNLKGFAGLLRFRTQSGKVFSREIADRVRVVACLTRLPNILTSDNTEETIDSASWQKIKKLTVAKSDDAIILVWGPHEDVKTAVKEIIIRAREATQGVPSETRQALDDGTNGFERILPGANRMYPDTDLPPIEIPDDRVNKLIKNVPEPLWEREKKYSKLGIADHLIILIASSPGAILFDSIVAQFKIEPKWIARYLFEATKAWQRAGYSITLINDTIWKTFFARVEKKASLIEKGFELFENFLQNEKTNLEKDLHKFLKNNYKAKDVKTDLKKLIDNDMPVFSSDEKKHKYLMGKIMKKYRGHIKGREISNIITNVLGDYND